MNKVIISMISIVTIILAITLGFAVWNSGQKEKKATQQEEIAKNNEVIEDECTEEYTQMENENLQTASTEVEEKIAPNAEIIFKTTHKKCGHTISKYDIVSNDLVNKTKEELASKYESWNIEKFSDTQIILTKTDEEELIKKTKERNQECGEHYMVREKDGKLVVFRIQENGVETEYETTEISLEYIPQTDLVNIKNGVRINGNEELNQYLENFE